MPLSPADIAALSQLLDAALALPAAARAAWIDRLPAEHRHLRGVLQTMLDRRSTSDGEAVALELPRLPPVEMPTGSGAVVGPYRLLREIGRGGMGSVWLARRIDGRYSRDVALKLPGQPWSEALHQRMLRERDIGALLEHPNIARLYDAGIDEGGRPYLAFEYVAGEPLDVWCRARALTIGERLRMFVQVVDAVAYAHGRLVVHRDLKPSNILVTPQGQVRLLDFGIAKLLQDSTAADPQLTREYGQAMTLQYASPEQISGAPVTVASDVYSLGIVLWELVVGTLPFQAARPTPGAMENAILRGDLPLASSRAPDKALARALRGDVDAILSHALRLEPAQRYATADGLAQDLRRTLEDQAVSVRPDSLAYRLRKTLWRHRVGYGAGLAVVVALASGAGVSLVQARMALQAVDRARVVKQFVVDVFNANTADGQLRKLPAELLLEHGAKLIEARFSGQPALQAELYGVVGGIYVDMGVPDVAEGYATKQVATLAAIDADRQSQATALLLLAQVYLEQERYADARLRVRRALQLASDDDPTHLHARAMLATADHLLGDDAGADREIAAIDRALASAPPTPSVDRASVLRIQALRLDQLNRFDEAVPLLKQAIGEALAAEGPPSRNAIDFRLHLARRLLVHNRTQEGRDALNLALDALRARGGANEVRAAVEESDYTKILATGGGISYTEARTVIERNRALLAAKSDPIPQFLVAQLDLDLGEPTLFWGNVVEAERLVSMATTWIHPVESAYAERLSLISAQIDVDLYAGRHVEADALMRQRQALRAHAGSARHPFAIYDYAWLARNMGMQGKTAQALAILDSAPGFDVLRGDPTLGDQYPSALDPVRARLLVDSGRPEAALPLLPKSIEPREPNDLLVLDDPQLILGEALCGVHRQAQGLAALDAAIDYYAGHSYAFNPEIARARAVAGLCALGAGQPQRARQYAKLSRTALLAQPGVSPYFKAPLDKLEHLLVRS